MNEIKTWHNQTMGTKAAAALQKRNFKAVFAADKKEAAAKIMELIGESDSVGVGGSVTLTELGILNMLSERGNMVYDHNKPGISAEDAMQMRRQELTADVFLTGTNAITMEGELINVDGVGNRVGAMIFGPKRVIVVAGVNKIVPDFAAGIERIKSFAAPMNNKRLNRQNPCSLNGQCMDCQGSGRICNVTTIMHFKPALTDVHIIIIGEELGF